MVYRRTEKTKNDPFDSKAQQLITEEIRRKKKY